MTHEQGGVPPLPPPPPPGDPTGGPSALHRKSVVRTAFAVFASGIAVLAVAIPIILSNSGEETSAETLVVEPERLQETGDAPEAEQAVESELGAEPGDNEIVIAAEADTPIGEFVPFDSQLRETGQPVLETSWLIPISMDLSGYPFADEEYCGLEQARWLRAHGALAISDQFAWEVDVLNEAASGGAISLTNIRFEGELQPAEPTVYMYCGPENIGGESGGIQPIDLRVDGSPAVFGSTELVFEPSDLLGVEGEIATVNVSPGQLRRISLRLYESHWSLEPATEYRGALVADMLSPEEKRVILVEEISQHGRGVTDFRLRLADYARCSYPEGEPFECTVAEAQDLLREAAESVGW